MGETIIRPDICYNLISLTHKTRGSNETPGTANPFFV